MSNDFELPSSSTPKPPVKVNRASHQPQSSAPIHTQSPEVTSKPDTSKSAEKPEFPPEELLRIFDEIIFSGEYRESFTIKDKLPVTFRTRTAEEISEIQQYIDGSRSNLISTVDNIRSLMNLQYALVNYRGYDLSMKKMDEKSAYIKALPGPIVGMLLTLLSKFDYKIAVACKEGEENF